MFTFKPYLVSRLRWPTGSMSMPSRFSASAKKIVRKIPFSITVEKAREVVLTGDFTGWSTSGIKLTPGEKSEWQTVLELSPGQHQYRILVDGKWSDYPKAAERVPNGFGGTNCVLVVA
jgi:hypothetical protein